MAQKRILIAVTIVSLGTLVACGPRAEVGANEAAGAKPPVSESNAAAEQAGLAQWRESLIGGCVAGGRIRVGPSPDVPVEAHCACAIDRTMAGKTLAQVEEEARSGAHSEAFTAAMRRCIAEISPDYPQPRRP